MVSTKAATEYSQSDKFISYAWFVPDGSSWGTAANASIAQPYIHSAEISYVEGVWRNPAQKYYWPKQGSLAFMSYSPSSMSGSVTVSSASHTGIQVASWNVNDHQDVDFMVADIQSGKTANEVNAGYTGVPTIFRHKLAKIVSFKVNTLKDYSSKGYKFYLKSIKIGNYPQIGSFTSGILPSATSIGNWVVEDGGKYSYVWYNDASGVEVTYSATSYTEIPSASFPEGVMVLPQIFSNPGKNPDYSTVPYIEVTYSVDRGSEVVTNTVQASMYSIFSTTGLSMNKKITLSLVISDGSKLITWAPDQEDWSSQGGLDISI